MCNLHQVAGFPATFLLPEGKANAGRNKAFPLRKALSQNKIGFNFTNPILFCVDTPTGCVSLPASQVTHLKKEGDGLAVPKNYFTLQTDCYKALHRIRFSS